MNELKLLKGSPMQVSDGIFVYPITIGEISDIGEETYNSYISAIATDKSLLNNVSPEDGISKEELNELYEYSDLEFILFVCQSNPLLSYTFFQSLSLFLKSKVKISPKGIVIENETVCMYLNSELFDEIKSIIFKQNFLKDNDKSQFKPANSKAKALMEKLKKAKEKIQKQNSDEGLSLKDITSIVATYSNDINIMSVWDLTVFQLYEAYLRLILWDEYHNKFILLPHSSDPQSLDLKHWATDLNKK